MLSRTGQFQGSLAGQHQQETRPDLTGREAGQHLKRDVHVAGADRPRPRRQQVVLLGGEPHRPEHLRLGVMGMLADPGEEARVVTGVAGPPPLGLAILVEAFLAVVADRFQQPVAGLRPVFLGHHQRPCHQGRQQLEHRVPVDALSLADRFGRPQGRTAGEHRQPG